MPQLKDFILGAGIACYSIGSLGVISHAVLNYGLLAGAVTAAFVFCAPAFFYSRLSGN